MVSDSRSQNHCFYSFQVLIQESDDKRFMGVGVVWKNYGSHTMPGWKDGTVGYLVDEGKIFGPCEPVDPTVGKEYDRKHICLFICCCFFVFIFLIFFIVPLIKGVSLRLLYDKKNIRSKLMGTGLERVQTDPRPDVQKRTIRLEPFGPFRSGPFRISISG